MRHFIAAQASREVSLKGHRTYEVPPPSVRQALTVLAFYQGEDEATEAERRMLRSVCGEWLPLPPFSVLFGDAFPEEERRAHLMGLIWAGIEPHVQEKVTAEQEEQEEDEDGHARADSYWTRQVMRYCHRLGTGYEKVMALPFPAFLGQLAHLGMLRAQDVKDQADAQILVRSKEGEDAYEQIAEQARGGGREGASESERPEGGAWSDDPEERKRWEAKKRAELHKVKQNMKTHRN